MNKPFTPPPIETLGFDPAELRERYRVEREKRLRGDGNNQYAEVVGDLAKYEEDPYITEKIVRDQIGRAHV